MSRFFSSAFADLIPYTPGEQPRRGGLIKLNTNESPFPPSALAVQYAAREAETLRLYSDPQCSDFRETAASYYGIDKDQIFVGNGSDEVLYYSFMGFGGDAEILFPDITEPDEVIFTNGSDEVLNFAFMAFCNRQHPAVFPNITYGFYPVYCAINHLPYREIPLDDDFRIRVSDYLRPSGTVYIANPNAPTGICLSIDEIRSILSYDRDRLVVVDEAYVDFGVQSCVGLINEFDNLLVTQTFSKSRSLAGGRLGMGFANRAIIDDMNTLKYSVNPYNVNRMTLAAGIGSLTDDEYMRSCVDTIIYNRNYTTEQLRSLGFKVTDSKANFVFAAHPLLDGGTLYESLKQRGILVRHFSKPRICNYNRITIGSIEDMQTLIGNIKQILEELK